MNTSMVEKWEAVEAKLKNAKAMHFDGCHKIYLSMDDAQVAEMKSYGYDVVAPDYDKLREWYDESCGLRFVEAVSTVEGNPNDGFESLIGQFDDEDDGEDEDA